jgi:hypothetical protein
MILIFLTIQLKEPNFIQEKFDSFKHILSKNFDVAKTALKKVFFDKNMRLLLIYRSLSSHVAFFFIISLPILVEDGMEEWFVLLLH